jgi:hypothetical protein
MSYLFNEAIPFGGTGGQFGGKNKGVLLTNTTGTAIPVDLYTYKANGTTLATRVSVLANDSKIFQIRAWGISCGAGITGALLS